MIPRRRLAVTRPEDGVRDPDTAKWIPGTPKKFHVLASVQPLTPYEMQSLPEGRRARAAYTLFSDSHLQTVTDNNPDTLVIDGLVFEVLSVAPFQNGILNHYRCVVSKMEIQP